MTGVVHEGLDDVVIPFAVEALDSRGRIVRLADQLNGILNRHAYPLPVACALGEAVALSMLLGSALKHEGRFQLQTKTDGVIGMIIVDYESPPALPEGEAQARIRAYARFDDDALQALTAHHRPKTAELLGKGVMALTIEQGAMLSRYQGVVVLNGQGFEEAAHQYFRQSEQIPTRVRLAVAETYETTDEGLTLHLFRAGGIMVQFLPVSPERAQQADFSPGDAPKGTPAPPEFQDDDAWIESRALIETVEDHELVDPTIGAERLLYRLFHERGVKVYKPLNVVELCRCTRERILNMLASFSAQERSDMGDEYGQVAITCEFCSRQYKLSCEEVENAVQTLTA